MSNDTMVANLFKTEKKVKAQLTSLGSKLKSINQQKHDLACSAVFYVATHGELKFMQQLHDMLPKSDRGAFKRWIVEHMAVGNNGCCVTFSKGQFELNKSKDAVARRAAIAESLKDVDVWNVKPFFEKGDNTPAEMTGDKYEKQFLRLVEKASEVDPENCTPKQLKLIEAGKAARAAFQAA